MSMHLIQAFIALRVCKLWLCCILSLPLLNLNRLWAHYSCSEVEFDYFWRLGEVKEVLHAHVGADLHKLEGVGALEVQLEPFGGVANHLEWVGVDLEHLEANWAIWRCFEESWRHWSFVSIPCCCWVLFTHCRCWFAWRAFKSCVRSQFELRSAYRDQIKCTSSSKGWI